MSIPGLLIEYLVNGAFALLVVYHTEWAPRVLEAGKNLPVLALTLYVVGMAIDILAFVVTLPLKNWVRKGVFSKYRPDQGADQASGTERQARISLYAPELSKELAMRSSRDRIARGLIINSFLATLLLQPIWVGVVATFLAVAMWMSFERLSYMFELCAEKVVDDKLASAKS
jgi:uncharacterized membrane protein